MKIQRVLSFDYALVITICILIVSTLGSPRPNYFDRNENPELSQWAEQHEDQVHEMANRLRTEYNRATTHDSDQNVPGGTGCKTTCIPSTTWVSNTGKTQEEISQIAKELTLKLVNDLNSGKIVYNQITQPNWFENYAAHELHLLQNQHYQNNFDTQIHIPQGTYYHKTEKKQVYEYTQGGGNIQPTYIYNKPTVTTYEEKKQETQKHSSSGYPTVYYGHGQNVEKIEKQKEHKDIETIAHVPVYTDSYFHSTDRKGHKKVQRRPTAAPAIHVSYNNQEDNAYAQNLHKVYPTTMPVTVTHKEQHMATVEKQTMPIIYKYGNNERKTEQTHHRNRTTSYRRPSTNSRTISKQNTTTTHFETQKQRPSQYSETKHSIYKHLRTDDGSVPNYRPRVIHKESKVSDYHGFGGGSVVSETIESHQIQNKTISSTNQQTSSQAQINYRPAYVGHQSRYNRTHGYNYTRPGYVIPGGSSQTSQTSHSSQTSHQARPGYAVIGGGQTSQTSSEKITETIQHRRPGYAITTGGSQNTNSTHSSQTEQHHTRPGYVLIGGGPQTSGISHTSQSSQQTSRPGYIVTGGGGGSTVIQTSYSNHTTQETRPGYIIRPGAHSNQISQNSHSSEHIVRPGYVIAGGGGSQTIETSHSTQTSQGGRPGHVVITGAGSQTVESSETSQTSHQGTRPGYVIADGGGSQTIDVTHSSQISQLDGRPGFVVVTGGGESQTVESSHTSQTSQQGSRPGYIFTGGGGSQTVETSEISETSQGTRPGYVIAGGGGSQTVDTHSSQTSQQGGRPGYVVITGVDGSQSVESSHISQTSQQGTRPGHVVITGGASQTVESSKISQTSHQGSRPGYIITGGVGSQTIETTHSSQTSHQGGRPGYVVVTGGDESQTVESSHTNQTSNQGTRPGFVVVGGGGTSQTLESYTNQTSQQGTRPGYIITSGGGQTIETTHSSQTSQQSGRPGFVVVSGGGSQTEESMHTSDVSQEVIQAEFIITGVGSSQIVENTHSSETIQQSGRPGYVVIAGGGESQTVESSLTNQTTQQTRPSYVTTGVGGQSIESTYLNHSSQNGGLTEYVVITDGGQSQTVETSHTSQTTQQGARPGYVITSGGGQTIVSSHINQTKEHNRPGYIITSGGSLETEQSIYSNQSTQHTRPGFIITGGGSQLEISHLNQSSQQTTRPGYVVTGSGSQTIESTQTNQTSQQSRPGYVVIGSGGQTSEISQTNETSEQTSKPGYIVVGGGSQSVESTHSSQTSEQSSRPGYIVTGGGGSQTSQTSHSSNSEEQHNSGYLVVGAGGQTSQTSHVNQTSEQTSRPGYIITGGGSQTIETSQTSQHSQDNRPGYVVVGGDESHTSQTSLTNQSSVQGSPGFVVIGGGGGSHNVSQEFISQLNQTGGGVYIANGSYISGLGFQEIETNWTSTTNNKKPYIIISKNRGDQPPHQFVDYFDSEEILEKEPGIGFYPTGIKPEMGLLVTRRPPTTNIQSQFDKHRSYGTHNSHLHSSHHNQNNHQTHLYPGSAVTTTTHKHHKHTIGTLPGDSRPLLEDHHVDKQSVEEGSSYNNQRSQSVITDNELRESYGFNKSKHHHESNEHRHSGIRHGQQQHSQSRQHKSGRHPHEHRHHHGDGQTGKAQVYFVTRDGRRQNVSRHDHEEMLKSQVNVLIENFARTVERDIQNIDPEDDKEAVQVDIVLDNMEKLLLQINSLVGDDPDTKKMIEQLIEHDLEAYQKKYRVKRSLLNLGFDSQTTKPTGSSQSTGINAEENIGADLASELFQKGPLSGTVSQLASLGFDKNVNTDSYPAGVNTYNPYDNILDTQNPYDLTQQTQNEDLSQFSLGFTNPPANPDTTQQHLENLTQQTQNQDLSQFLLGFTHQQDKSVGSIKPNTDSIKKYLEDGSEYRGSEYDGQENLNEGLTHILDNNQHSQNFDTPGHINFALSPEYPTHLTNNRNTHRIYQPIVPMHPTSSIIQHDNTAENIKIPGTCCWKPGSPNYQLIGSQTGNNNINVAPVGEIHSFRLINPIYQPIGQSLGFPVPSTTSQAGQQNVSGPDFNQNKVQIQIDNYRPPLYPIYNPTNKPKKSDSKPQPILQTELPITDKQSSYDPTQQTQNADLSKFSLGFTYQPALSDKTQQHLEKDFSLFDSKHEAGSSNIYSGKGGDNHTLETQSLYDLTQQTQNEAQVSLGFTYQPAKPVGSIKPNTGSIQQHLEEYPYIDTEDDGQETLNEHLTQIIDNDQPSQNFNTQEHVNFDLSPGYPNYPNNNYNTYPMHPTSSFIQQDPSILAGNIKVPATCCWEPGSPNYQPIGSQTDNININVAPVGGKLSFKPINPIYQPIGQSLGLTQQDPSILAGNIKVPATCCWEPGSPNYQPIGSQTDNININVALVGGKLSFKPINPIYQPIGQLHSSLVSSTTSQARQENVSGNILNQNKIPVPSENYSPPLHPIRNILPSLPIYVAIDKTRNLPQTTVAPILQSKGKLFDISNEKSSSLISMTENLSHIEKSNDFTVTQDVQEAKRCCWQSVGPNYQPISATTYVTNIGSIVGPVGNVLPPPCQTNQATPINPTYIPIDGLSKSIGADKPIETIKLNNFEGSDPDRPQVAYPDKRYLVNIPHTGQPDYQGVPIYNPYVIPKQLAEGSRPVHPSGTIQQSSQEEQSLVDIQQSSYPTYSEEQKTNDTAPAIYPGLSVSDSQFTLKENEDINRLPDQRPVYPTASTYQTAYSDGDINYVPGGNILFPLPASQSKFNSTIGNQKSETLAYDGFGGLQIEEKTQLNQISNQQTQQSIGSSGQTYNYLSHQNQSGVINERSGNITYSSVRHVFYPQNSIPIVNDLQTNNSNQQTDHRTTEENTNINKIQKSGHSQTRNEIQRNQFINQETQGNNQSSVQEKTQSQPMDSQTELHTYKVEQSKQQGKQHTVQGTQQFREKTITSASGFANTVHHSIENQQEKTSSNTQEISTQTPNPKESNKTDHRRGDQTAFDEMDYDDDNFYESNVKIVKPDKNDELTQNTVSLDDYFQYSDPDPELQQLTQQITDADFTNFVKSPHRFKRQLAPISVLDFVPHKSSNSNSNFLVSDENAKSVKQAQEVMIDYQNHPRNLNHI